MESLDIYDIKPKAMVNYLRYYGWHFNKKMCDYAVSRMKRKNKTTNQIEKIQPLSKEQVDELLKAHNVNISNKEGYDYVYVANMCRADYYGSSIADDYHLILFVKDMCDDVDADSGSIFRCWYAKAIGSGMVIEWEDMI